MCLVHAVALEVVTMRPMGQVLPPLCHSSEPQQVFRRSAYIEVLDLHASLPGGQHGQLDVTWLR